MTEQEHTTEEVKRNIKHLIEKEQKNNWTESGCTWY